MVNSSENTPTTLTNSIAQEIINTSIDLSIDYAELDLDLVFGDNLIKEIPIVKTLYAIGKIGISINERYFVKKILTFLKELHSGTVSEEQQRKFKMKFDDDHKYRGRVTEHIIVYINSFLDIEKAKILARLFSAHISGHLEWARFLHLSACLNTLNLSAIYLLEKLAERGFQTAEEEDDRDYNGEALLSAGGIGYTNSPWSSGYYIADSGKDLYNFGIKNTAS